MRCMVVVLAAVVVSLLGPALPQTTGGTPGTALQAASPQITVIDRVPLGVLVEDITYVPKGVHKGTIAMVAGSTVVGVPASGQGPAKVKRLFDLTAAGPWFRANGIAYIDDLDVFAFDTREDVRRGWPQHIYMVDAHGHAEQWGVARTPAQWQPTWVEGLAYLPETAAGWPEEFCGTLLMVGGDASDAWIEVLAPEPATRQFRVIFQVRVPPPLYDVGDIAPLPGGEVRIVAYDGSRAIYRSNAWDWSDGGDASIESTGTLNLSSAVGMGEGLAVLPTHELVVVDSESRLYFLPDAPVAGVWTPTRDVDGHVGFGISSASGLAWDSRRDRFLLRYLSDATQVWPEAIGALTVPSKSWQPLGLLSTEPNFRDRNFAGMTYDPVADRVVVARLGRYTWETPFPARTPALVSFPAGGWDNVSAGTTTDLSLVLHSLAGTYPALYASSSWNNGPGWITYNPEGWYATGFVGDPWDTFSISAGDVPAATLLFNLTGPGICDAALPEFRTATATYIQSRGEYLVYGTCRRTAIPLTRADLGPPLLVLTDAVGQPIMHVDLFTALGTWAGTTAGYMTAVTSGPFKGALAFLDVTNSEVIVFKIR